MQDEISHTPVEEDERAQRSIMELLLSEEGQRPLSVEELARHIGGSIAAIDALTTLHAEGLVHRCGDFAFATRAAMCMDSRSL